MYSVKSHSLKIGISLETRKQAMYVNTEKRSDGSFLVGDPELRGQGALKLPCSRKVPKPGFLLFIVQCLPDFVKLQRHFFKGCLNFSLS